MNEACAFGFVRASRVPHDVEIVGVQRGTVALLPPVNADRTTSFVFPDDVPGATALEPATAFCVRVTRGDHVLGEARFETAPASAAQMPRSLHSHS